MTGLKAAGRFLEAPKRAFTTRTKMIVGYRGQGQVASEGRKRIERLNAKGFWEGVVMPKIQIVIKGVLLASSAS